MKLHPHEWMAAAMVVVIAAGGYVLSNRYLTPKRIAEPAAPSIQQADGSKVLEREGPEAPKAKPAHQIPKGGTEERRVSVTVKPYPGTGVKLAPSGTAQATSADCPPVTVDLSLVKMPDDTRRVVASSRDGEVIGGLDVPLETISRTSSTWAAGLSWSPTHQTPGVWLERDLSRLRVGAEINQTRIERGGPTGAEVRIRVGWTW